MIWSSVGSTRLQNGHWKSLNSTIVTSASGVPLTGSPAVTGTLKRSGPSFSSTPLTLSSAGAAPASAVASPEGEGLAVTLPSNMPAQNAKIIDTSAEPLLTANLHLALSPGRCAPARTPLQLND